MALIIMAICVTLLFGGIVALGEWGDAHRHEWEIEDKVRKSFSQD